MTFGMLGEHREYGDGYTATFERPLRVAKQAPIDYDPAPVWIVRHYGEWVGQQSWPSRVEKLIAEHKAERLQAAA